MKNEISLSNIWMCLTVVFIHIVSYSIPHLDVKNIFDIVLLSLWALSLYVVPGFIFFSGMKSFLSKNFSYPKFLLKRVKTVLIPYLIWSAVYLIYFHRYSSSDEYRMMPYSELFRGITLGNVTGHLYFVVIIMQFYLLMPLWRIIVKKLSPHISVPLFFVVMITAKQFLLWLTANYYPEYFDYTDRIFLTYIAFWISGCYAGKYYNTFRRIISKSGIPVCVIFTVSTLLMILVNFQKYFMCQNLPFIENVYTMYQFSAIIFMYFISLNLSRQSEEISKGFMFRMINSQSYSIYLSHCLVLMILHQMMKDSNLGNNIQLLVRFWFTYLIVILFYSIYFGIISAIKSVKPRRNRPKHDKT